MDPASDDRRALRPDEDCRRRWRHRPTFGKIVRPSPPLRGGVIMMGMTSIIFIILVVIVVPLCACYGSKTTTTSHNP